MSIQQKTIPITPVRTLSESYAIETASRAVENFLSVYYPSDFISRQRSGAAIVGQWISIMPGRERNQASDIVDFARDLVIQIQLGDQRSLISDALSFFLGGLMPTYSRAKVLAGMLADIRPAVEVEAYFHSIGYGSVKEFIEQIGPSMKSRATTKCELLTDVMMRELQHLDAEWHKENTILLAQAAPNYAPTKVDVPGGTAANDPKVPRAQPNLRLVPPPEPPPASGGARLIAALRAIAWSELLIIAVVLSIPGDTPDAETKKKMDDFYREREEKKKLQNKEHQYIKQKQEALAESQSVGIPLQETQMEGNSNCTNNQTQSQIDENRKNGAQCEDDGYVLMEKNLQYKRLVNPPTGRGLDGLFEKIEPSNSPNPMPESVQIPKPGKLIFIPTDARPPQARFDYTGKPPQSCYPKFVVWEAKHISKTFDPSDTEGMKKAGKNALGVTCDGSQMSEPWTEKRIPQALTREKEMTAQNRTQKLTEIRKLEYARWMFLCLPGPVGGNTTTKQYVLIDIVQAGIDLESIPAKPRKQAASKEAVGY